MSFVSSELLYKTAAVIYGITVPGHIVRGYQVVYDALDKIPKARFEDRAAERGAANCWNFLTTSLAASALLNWQWARTGGPSTSEELVILGITNVHTFVNGLRYLQVGDYASGLAIITPSTISLAAFLLQTR